MTGADAETGGIVGEFFALKRAADADVLAMQVGDFYEFFDEDAELVGRELDLKVSEKGSAGEQYPMAGVPISDLTPYLKALVERGYRVAVADQHETADGHAREVTRVATPGTLLETTDAEARYLGAVVRDDGDWGLAFADVTTGQFLVTDVTGTEAREEALSELYRFDPAEVLPGPELRNESGFVSRIRDRTDAAVSVFEADAFAPGRAAHRVREQFGRTAETVGVDPDGSAVRAAGAILAYVEETGTGVLASMTRLRPYRDDDHVTLDATTGRNLELVESMTGEGPTLFEADSASGSPGPPATGTPSKTDSTRSSPSSTPPSTANASVIFSVMPTTSNGWPPGSRAGRPGRGTCSRSRTPSRWCPTWRRR
jgi:DNA mismatch repair protein MutS